MNALTLALKLGLMSLLAAVSVQAQPSLPILKAEPPADTIRLRSGQLPLVGLTPDILYRILVAEIAATRGEYDVASQTFLSLARDTSDPRLAQNAFLALHALHGSGQIFAIPCHDGRPAVAVSHALNTKKPLMGAVFF